MKRLLAYFSSDQWVIIFVVVLLFVLFARWIEKPSRWRDEQSEYTTCLELILRDGTIVDAQMMCNDLKEKP